MCVLPLIFVELWNIMVHNQIYFCVSTVIFHYMLKEVIMAADRTAIDTITGYYYQFDYYILELLKCTDPKTAICIEAIEDVDITTADETTAVQCKYYAKTALQPSTLKKPIRLMLEHFAHNPGTRGYLRYALYGCYKSGQDKFPEQITLDYLKKKLLIYTEQGVEHQPHVELGLSDGELQQFLGHLYINVRAPSFEEQEEQILATLKHLFKCTDVEAEFFYSNALRLVRELSTKQDMKDRTITAEQFRSRINTSTQLFDSWYLKVRGVKTYCSAIKKQYFTAGNISPYERFFLIDCDDRSGVQELKTLILRIQQRWSKLSLREKTPFCPYVLLHGASAELIAGVKRALHSDGFRFRDGFDFLGADFDPDSVIEKPTSGNGIQLKFLTEQDHLEEVLDTIRRKTRVVYQFYLNVPYYEPVDPAWAVHRIRIAETGHITDMI